MPAADRTRRRSAPAAPRPPVEGGPELPGDLGRGVIVGAGQVPPHSDLVHLDDAALAQPADLVDLLHRHWAERRPVTVVLDIDPVRLRLPDGVRCEPNTIAFDHLPWSDRLHFLLWANNLDRRTGESIWWWARKAMRLGATECLDGSGDVLLPDGRAAWIDGGPRDARVALAATVIHAETIDLGRLTPLRAPVASTAELAADQLAAVSHAVGPARIIAPAGSGKTRVLTERLRHLVLDRGVEPSTILALAYNRRAQREMEARAGNVGVPVRTLNALGFEIVREQRPHARMADEREVRNLISDLLPDMNWKSNTDPIAPYIEALAQVRLGLRDAATVAAGRDDVDGLADLFPRYRAALAERDSLDFDEQIYSAVAVLLEDGEMRRRWQRRSRHLLVDEFQDLRPLHMLMIRLLASPELDVFGVGDDDQVVYGYDGATPRYLTEFGRHFPGAAMHALTVNYRCSPAVVGAASALLSHNRIRVDKDIVAAPGRRPERHALVVRHHPAANLGTEIVSAVQQLLEAGAAPADVVLLARVNSALLVPRVVLAEAGIAVCATTGPEVLERTGIRAALAYLRLAGAGERLASADIGEVLRRPSRGLPPWFSERLHRRRSWSVADLAAIDGGDRGRAGLERLVADISGLQRVARTATTERVLRHIRDSVGLGGAMALLGHGAGAERPSHLDDLDQLERLAALQTDPREFERWLRESLARPSEEDGVTLSTVHRVKGLEWDHVIVIGASEGQLPHRLAEDIEEERRVFHVALTRSRRRVIVLADRDRPSPFLHELEHPAVAGAPAPSVSSVADQPVIPLVGERMLVAGGIEGEVVRLTSTGATLALGPGTTLLVRIGERVCIGERRGPLQLAARSRSRSGIPVSGDGGPVEQALRSWRSERARVDGVPPYVVMHDTTLLAIASARPHDGAGLAAISGIGPSKLERYGAELLAVLATAD